MNLHKSPFACIMFLCFVFLVTIVLFNLLNALAISDTQKILDEGEIADMSMKVNVLHHYEQSYFHINSLNSFLQNFIQRKLSIVPYNKKGKVLINLNDGQLQWVEKKAKPNAGKATIIFAEKMDPNIIEKLQCIINEKNDRTESQKILNEMNERVKKLELLLDEVLMKFDK